MVDKVMTTRQHFGDYRRQLFGLEHTGMPEKTIHEVIDLFGTEVLPVLRSELAAAAL